MAHEPVLVPDPPPADVRQALYELAEGIHSAGSIQDVYGRSMLDYLVSCGWAADADPGDPFPTTTLDRRLPDEAVLTLTDDGWAQHMSASG